MSRPKSEEHKKKLKEHLDRVRTIVTWTPELKKRVSESLKGNQNAKNNPGRIPGTYKHSQETRNKISNSLKGGVTSDGWKFRSCPHCGKTGRGPNMSRYHFDNCKSKVVTL